MKLRGEIYLCSISGYIWNQNLSAKPAHFEGKEIFAYGSMGEISHPCRVVPWWRLVSCKAFYMVLRIGCHWTPWLLKFVFQHSIVLGLGSANALVHIIESSDCDLRLAHHEDTSIVVEVERAVGWPKLWDLGISHLSCSQYPFKEHVAAMNSYHYLLQLLTLTETYYLCCFP